MKVIYYLIFLCLYVLPNNRCFAQKILHKDTVHSYFIGSKFQLGSIVTDNSQVASLIEKNPLIFQLDFSILNNTQQSWNTCTCYTKNGLSLSYVNFGNHRNLGQAFSLAVFTEPYLALSKKIQITLRGGVGISHLNKIYDSVTNPNNLAYSRHLSFLLLLNSNLYYNLNPRTLINFGVQFSHISNGGSQWPNWGINFPTASIGIEYVIKPLKLSVRPRVPFKDRSLKVITHFFGGRHSSDHSNTQPEERRIVAGVAIGLIKQLSRVNGLGIGGELYYDPINKINKAGSGKEYTSEIAAISLQHYFFLGRIIFGQHLAYYVTPLNPNVSSKLYQRYYLAYKIKDPFYVGVSLKSHGVISDYVALSVGLVF